MANDLTTSGGYYPDTITDDLLKELEKRIRAEYSKASKEMEKKAQDYFDNFQDRFIKEYDAYKRGEYTQQQFIDWYYTQVARGKGWEQMSKELADRACNANKVASTYINDGTPTIWTINRNFEAYVIDQATGIDFHAYDEQTVRRLIANDEIKLPQTKPNYAKDFMWNKKKMNSALISNILQGKSIYELGKSFQTVTNMNQNAALRNARTCYTGAQNAGRLASMLQAQQMGVKIKKEWVSTLDDRTRVSHQDLDGELQDANGKFSNGLRYPGDTNGQGCEIYNCRCTMITTFPGITDDAQRRARDENGNNVIVGNMTYNGRNGSMSYKEWIKERTGGEENAKDGEEKAPKTTPKIKGAKQLMLEDLQEKQMLDDISNALVNNANEIIENAIAEPSEKMKELINSLNKGNVDYKEVKKHDTPLKEDDIISTISGGDKTYGSCVSVGLAYCGQKCGFDVTDYRGGTSLDWFSEKANVYDLCKLPGLNMQESTAKSQITAGNQLLKQIKKGEPNKEYYLAAGGHASIVKLNENGKLQYLELQKEDSGWKDFNGNARHTLATRFGCSGTNQGEFLNKAFMVGVDDFKNCDDFQRVLGYINTNQADQKKGEGGFAK